MERVSEPEAFLHQPLGKIFMAKTFAAWCARHDLVGFSLWGCPSRYELDLLLQFVRAAPECGFSRRRSLVDLKYLDTFDQTAFSDLARHIAARRQHYKEQLSQQALIRPDGVVGALIAGFYAVVPADFPTKVFDAFEPAASWLGMDSAPELITELRAALHSDRADPVTVEVRRVLTDNLCQPTLACVARSIGVSQRTLQRQLRTARTTFSDELNNVKLTRARNLMLASRLSLGAIAMQAGFASSQHFSTLFRQQHNESPREWRRRQLEAP